MTSILDSSKALAIAIEHGLLEIHCNLTGRIIGQLDSSVLDAAIKLEQYNDPLVSDDDIVDSMQLRFLIQNSKPSPHLVANKTYDGFKFLRTHYPRDLFAILASRMIFDNAVSSRMIDSLQLRMNKMQWLLELQAFFAATPQDSGLDAFDEVLDTLVRLDAIHDVRKSFYTQRIKDAAMTLATKEFDYNALAAFVFNTETDAFHALTTMKNPPAGNTMALSAALAAMNPVQLDLYEKRQESEAANRRAVINRIAEQARRTAGGGKVIKRVVHFEKIAANQVSPVLPASLAAKYETLSPKFKDSAAVEKVKAKTSSKASKMEKALARFGDISNLDLDI